MTTPCLTDVLPEVEARVVAPGPILLGLDFDGTLAPIMPRPEDVVLAGPVRALLARLADTERVTVMIVSGRGLRDVADRVGLPGLIYAGNHGLEVEGPGLTFLEPTAAAAVGPLADLTAGLRARLAGLPGALVEPKGLTTSVHYRNVAAEHQDDLARAVKDAVGADPARFVLTTGHAVWEVRPRASWHKGQALEWVVSRLGGASGRLVFYLGDDRTDEDAFASLPDGVTVKVGSAGVPTRARYRLPGPDSVHAFLGWLAGRLTR